MNYIFPNQVLTHTYLLAHFLIIASPKSNQTSPGTLSHLKATLPPPPPWFWSVLPKGHPDGLTPLLLICLTCRPPWPPWCWSSWSLPPTHQSSGSWAGTGTPSSLAAGSTDQDSVKNCRMYHALSFVKNNCHLIQWTLILFCCWRY